MSRRYGRNQRRKARQEIERLQSVASSHYAEKLAHLRKRQEVEGELVEWAARIVNLLGDETAFARDLAEIGVDAALFSDAVNHGMPMRLRAPMVESLRPGVAQMVDHAYRVVQAFAVYAEKYQDVVSRRCRFVVRAPDGDFALMMDERTLQVMRQREDGELVRHLLGQLAMPWMKAAR